MMSVTCYACSPYFQFPDSTALTSCGTAVIASPKGFQQCPSQQCHKFSLQIQVTLVIYYSVNVKVRRFSWSVAHFCCTCLQSVLCCLLVQCHAQQYQSQYQLPPQLPGYLLQQFGVPAAKFALYLSSIRGWRSSGTICDDRKYPCGFKLGSREAKNILCCPHRVQLNQDRSIWIGCNKIAHFITKICNRNPVVVLMIRDPLWEH